MDCFVFFIHSSKCDVTDVTFRNIFESKVTLVGFAMVFSGWTVHFNFNCCNSHLYK